MDFTEGRRKRGRSREGVADNHTSTGTGSLNTAQSIASVLREQILTGQLAPCTRVTQRDLAAQFGRSPMPARDAVKILLAEGLVVQESSKTIVVAPVTLDGFVEIMDLRGVLEPHALELSIPRLSTEQFAEARAVLALSGTSDCTREMAANHWAFHRILYSGCSRSRLLSLIEQQHNLLVRYMLPEWAMLGVMKHWGDDELELMELVEQRRVPEAADWLRRDLKLAADRVIRPGR
ncbi:MAG TPA: GntR family transcriptional regulator [Dongiaceae bacterium]|jgi:DNA-binding GntR family transcriptional regulator|nr:GntR family transcriptional regulator [Dongiaceae bacterium]